MIIRHLNGVPANGHLLIVQYLVEKGANIYTNDNYALIWSAVNGHLLINNGSNIHTKNDYALKWGGA